jgi:predicted N-acetyltransferase YhbS
LLTPLQVRPCEAADCPGLWSLLEPVFRAGETFPHDPAITEAVAQVASVEHSQAVMVALDATGALVGTYYLRPHSLALGAHVANAGYVVAEQARRRGIGSRLCQHSLQAARRLGLRRCLGGVPGPGAGAEAMQVVPLRRNWIEQPYGEEEFTLLEEEVIPAIQPASTSYLTLTPSRNGSGLTAACRSEEQTAWLVEVAKQAHGTGTTRVFVVTEVDQPRVAAYYASCMASVAITDLPERLRRGAGRYPQPVALLARLGVDQRHKGQGLGAALLLDVITQVASLAEASLSDSIGCRGLLVHAESEQALGFYVHLIPEFERSPTDPLHLLLLLKDIRRTLRR